MSTLIAEMLNVSGGAVVHGLLEVAAVVADWVIGGALPLAAPAAVAPGPTK